MSAARPLILAAVFASLFATTVFGIDYGVTTFQDLGGSRFGGGVYADYSFGHWLVSPHLSVCGIPVVSYSSDGTIDNSSAVWAIAPSLSLAYAIGSERNVFRPGVFLLAGSELGITNQVPIVLYDPTRFRVFHADIGASLDVHFKGGVVIGLEAYDSIVNLMPNGRVSWITESPDLGLAVKVGFRQSPMR